MKSRLQPPTIEPDISTKYDALFTWEIVDWFELTNHEYSSSFQAGGFTWKLIICLQGNDISLYLAVVSPGTNNQGQSRYTMGSDWVICGQFVAALWNPNDTEAMVLKNANHRFTQMNPSWGFAQFFKNDDILSPICSNGSCLVSVNGKVNISVYLRILDDPTGVWWHNMQNYNSRKATGYTGLVNYGTTCHLNSLLQSLYFTAPFRNAVHQLPTDNEAFGIAYALQQIFIDLTNSEKPVETRLLTKAFGWNSNDSSIRYDVQETARILMATLENKMQLTAVDGDLHKLFVGQARSFVQCVNVPFETSRREDYWSIQLNVRGFNNLYKSFDDYVQVEMLQGDNRYMARQYGLQDARKGFVFLSYPPVFYLQLKRYDFDHVTGKSVKINDFFEFPADIDLSPYLNKTIAASKDNCEYTLHSVIVHSVESGKGHYHSYVKPTKDGPWYKFYDEQVTRATKKQVFDDNFGGCESSQRNSSAYMLVYIRKSMVGQILHENPAPILTLNPRPRELDLRKSIQNPELGKRYTTIHVASAMRQFKNNTSYDIAVFNNSDGISQTNYGKMAVADSFRIPKSTTFEQLMDYIQKELYPDVDLKSMRLWTMTKKYNETYRLGDYIKTDPNKSLDQMKRFRKYDKNINLFLEIADPMEVEHSYRNLEYFYKGDRNSGKRTLLFLKYFNPVQQSLVGVTSVVLYGNSKIQALVPIVCQTMGWPPDTPLRIWEEVNAFEVKLLDITKMVTASKLFNGHILVFERILSPRYMEYVLPVASKTTAEYYDFLHNQIKITFKRCTHLYDNSNGILNIPTQTIDDYTIVVSKKSKYQDVVKTLANRIGVGPTNIQLLVLGPRCLSNQSVNHIVRPLSYFINNKQTSSIEIQYDCSQICNTLFDNHDLFEYIWLDKGKYVHQKRHSVIIPKITTLSNFRLVLPFQVGINSSQLDMVRVWTVSNHRLQERLKLDHRVALAKDKNICFALATPEEYDLDDNDHNSLARMIEVFHFYKNVNCTHGIPFRFALIRNEPFIQTRVRLRKALGMNDNEFGKVKFAVVNESGYTDCIEGDTEDNLPSYADVVYSHNEMRSNRNESGVGYINLGAGERESRRLRSRSRAEIQVISLGYDTKLFDMMCTTDALGLDYDGEVYYQNLATQHFIYINN